MPKPRALIEAEDLVAGLPPLPTTDVPALPEPQDQNYISGLIDQFADGATFGFWDNIAAAEAAVLGRTPGGDWFNYDETMSKRYEDALAAERAQQKAFEEANPKAALAANITGGLGLGFGAARSGATLLNRPMRSTAEALKLGAAEGSLWGALYGVGTSDGENVMRNILFGAGGGGLTGGLGTAAFHKVMGSTLVQPAKKAIAHKTPPEIINVKEHYKGPPNLTSIETTGDVVKAHWYDSKTPLQNLMDRAEPHLPFKWTEFDINTGTEMSRKVNHWNRTGHLVTPDATLKMNTTPQLLMQEVAQTSPDYQKALNRYLLLKDQMDDAALEIANNGKNATMAQAVITGSRRALYAIERQFPQVKVHEAKVRHITNNMLDFMSKGKGAVLSQDRLNFLRANRQHYIPHDLTNVNPNAPLLTRMGQASTTNERINIRDRFLRERGFSAGNIDERNPALETLHDYTLNVLKFQAENAQRLKFIDAMENSKYGTDTIRKATTQEVKDFPNRIVEVYEQGKKVKYIGSYIPTDLLQLDPQVVKYPYLYGPRRMFEVTRTGWGNPGFAGTVFFRDSLMTAIANGQRGASPVQSLMAVPQALYQEGKLALSNQLRTNLKGIPLVDTNKVADNLADSYMRSWLHTVNTGGGVDASLSRNEIALAHGALREATSAVGDAWNSKWAAGVRIPVESVLKVLDTMKEAPRLATAKKLIAQGEPVDEAILFARQVTGDASKQGLVFRRTGDAVTGDIVPDASRKLITDTSGEAAQIARESLPWYNPAVRGMAKLANSYRQAPAETSLRAWLYAGLPALATYAWNEMGGPEYNNFHDGQTGYNKVMFLPIRIPGRPPEEMARIPLAHEVMLQTAPYRQLIHNLNRSDREVGTSMMHTIATMLENSAILGAPPVVQAGFAAQGLASPDAFTELASPVLTGRPAVYQRREDYDGFLNVNTEMLLRTLFGNANDLVYESLNAAADGAVAEGLSTGVVAGLQQAGNVLGRNVPVLRDHVHPNVYPRSFHEDADKQFQEVKAMETAADQFKELFGDQVTSSRARPKDPRGYLDDVPDTTRSYLAPAIVDSGPNHLLKEVGPLIHDRIKRGNAGYPAIRHEKSKLRKQIKRLQAINAGRARGDMKQWQARLKNLAADEATFQKAEKHYKKLLEDYNKNWKRKKADTPGRTKKKAEVATAKANWQNLRLHTSPNGPGRMIIDNNLDLTKHRDRRLLVSLLNKRYRQVLDAERQFLEDTKKEIEQIAKKRSYIKQDETIDLQKHLQADRLMRAGQAVSAFAN